MDDPSEKGMASHAEAAARYLAGATEPVNARALGAVLRLKGATEPLRRAVRRIVEHARRTLGLRICANLSGYWLARDADEWREYQAAIAANLRFKFYRISQTKAAVVNRMNEQGTLFDRPVDGSEAQWAMW